MVTLFSLHVILHEFKPYSLPTCKRYEFLNELGTCSVLTKQKPKSTEQKNPAGTEHNTVQFRDHS